MRIDVLYYEDNHWCYFSINHRPGNIIFFICDSVGVHILLLTSNINEFFADSTIYTYGNSPFTKSDIQRSKGCFWYALEFCFRLSKIDFFSILERNALIFSSRPDLHEKYLSVWGSDRDSFKRTVFIFPQTIPPEMGAIFFACQSNATYNNLSQSVLEYPLSKKERTLPELIAYRHFHGLNPLKLIRVHWQDSTSSNQSLNSNQALLYFLNRQIEKLKVWLPMQPLIYLNAILDQSRKFQELITPIEIYPFFQSAEQAQTERAASFTPEYP